jgi:hypothetical protein
MNIFKQFCDGRARTCLPGAQSSPPYERGVAAASADGVVLCLDRTHLACMDAPAFKGYVFSLRYKAETETDASGFFDFGFLFF